MLSIMSNMYVGVKTWNPLGGECPHKCGYCSTKTMSRFPVVAEKYSGPLRLYVDVLRKGPGCEGKRVFVAAQNDLFAREVPADWIREVLHYCHTWDNEYLFQTKNPARLHQFIGLYPPNSILCTTIETNRSYPQMGKTVSMYDRAIAMNQLIGVRKWITIEPMMDFDLEAFCNLVEICGADQVNIGADSKGHNLIEPSSEKLNALIVRLRQSTNVVLKDNLKRLL
jgi:protein gp37